MRGLGYGVSRAVLWFGRALSGARAAREPATFRIGHVTLYEGKDGRVCRASYDRSDAFERLLAGEINSEQYVTSIRQRVREARSADAFMGKRWRRYPLGEHPGDSTTESPARANPKHPSVRDRREV